MEQIIEAQYIKLLLFGYKKFVGAHPNKNLSNLKNWPKELQDKILSKL